LQDTLLGAKLITQRDTFIGKDLMMNILMNIMDWDGTVPMPTILKPEPLWTGKQVRQECVHMHRHGCNLLHLLVLSTHVARCACQLWLRVCCNYVCPVTARHH
jgi:hypothetical protein